MSHTPRLAYKKVENIGMIRSSNAYLDIIGSLTKVYIGNVPINITLSKADSSKYNLILNSNKRVINATCPEFVARFIMAGNKKYLKMLNNNKDNKIMITEVYNIKQGSKYITVEIEQVNAVFYDGKTKKKTIIPELNYNTDQKNRLKNNKLKH